ncbi:MAG: GNAT family N-acetyltransferase [Pseudomonadota bacterium]
MSWDIKPARDAFPAFTAEWDRLNGALYDSHPMFDSRFIGPLLEYFGDGSEFLCIHRSDGKVNGGLILTSSGWGRWTLFQPSQAQLGTLVLKDARLLTTLFAALPGHAWSIDLLALDPDYSPDWSNSTLPRQVAVHALTMAAEMPKGFADYWQARPNQLKQNFRRYRRRSDTLFPERNLVSVDSPQSIEAAVDRYGELESSGWKGKAGTAVHSSNRQGIFYRKVMQLFAATGQAQVLELQLGEKLAASRLIIGNPRMAIMLKTAFDESLANVAPGRQLLNETLQRVSTRSPHQRIEFYTNATRDQSDWATSLRYICHHQIFRNKFFSGIYQLFNAIRPSRPVIPADKIKFPVAETIDCPRVDDLPDTAASLFTAAETLSFDAGPGWFANLQQTVFVGDAGIGFHISIFWNTPRVVLPLRRITAGKHREIQSLGHFYTSLYSPVLAANTSEVDLATLLQHIGHDHDVTDVMRFAPLDRTAQSTETLLTSLRSIGWIPFRFYCFGNWYLPVKSDWNTYLNARPSQLRNGIRRKGKKFAAVGGTLEIITTGNAIEAAIHDYCTVYAKSWKKPEPYPAFIPGLIRWLATRGWLRMGIARLAGQPIGAQIWIVAHGKASIFKLAYDEAFAAYGTGTLLTARLMEHAMDHDKVSEVDYLIGDDPYKQSWMSHRRERWGIVAYNPRTVIGLLLLLRETLGHLWNTLAKKPSGGNQVS